jgi:hypothetical protein
MLLILLVFLLLFYTVLGTIAVALNIQFGTIAVALNIQFGIVAVALNIQVGSVAVASNIQVVTAAVAVNIQRDGGKVVLVVVVLLVEVVVVVQLVVTLLANVVPLLSLKTIHHVLFTKSVEKVISSEATHEVFANASDSLLNRSVPARYTPLPPLTFKPEISIVLEQIYSISKSNGNTYIIPVPVNVQFIVVVVVVVIGNLVVV